MELSIYETGGMFHAVNNPAKTPAECLVEAKALKAREDAAGEEKDDA